MVAQRATHTKPRHSPVTFSLSGVAARCSVPRLCRFGRGSILTLLKLECRLNMFGKLHGGVPVRGKAGQQLRQKFELLARQNTEERIVHRTLQAGETDQPVKAFLSEGKLHAPTIAR